MGEPTTPQAPQLPKDVPEDLRKFLECTKDEVTLKDGTLSWLSVKGKDLVPADMGSFVPDSIMNGTVHPGLTITPDPSAPGKAEMKIGIEIPGLGTVGPSIPMSVENGTLTADTSGLPKALKDQIDSAIKNLNDWFKANGNGFGPPTFGSGSTKLTKIKLQPPPGKTVEPPPPVKAPPPKPPPVAPPAAPGGGVIPGGCLGILFLVLAVVAVGAILFFGGSALGLFGFPGPAGTSSPTAAVTATPTAPATATASASATPDYRIVRSDDGRAFLHIPFDSAPADAPIALTARGQADAPPELAGITFRSAFYEITPMDQAFTGEIGFGRLVDVGEQGLDPDEVGYSVTSLALRTYDGMWSWLGGQGSLIGGTTGTSPETQVQQKGSLMHVGEVFGIGGTVWAHRDPYPEEVEFAVGTTVRFGVKLTGPNGGPFVTGQTASILRAAKYTSVPGIVTVTDPVISVGSDGFPRMDVTATCTLAGDLVVGSDLVFSQTGTSSLLDELDLDAPPEHEMSFRTSMRCVTGPGALNAILGEACVRAIHQALLDDPSFLRWQFGFSRSSVIPAGSTLRLAYREGASAPLRTYEGFPIADFRVVADTGITSYGTKIVEDISIVQSIDQAAVSLYEQWKKLGGAETFEVTSQEVVLSGSCPNF